MAGNPLAAMALIGLGYRSLSMSAAAIGPVKAMTLALDAGKAARRQLDGASSTTATARRLAASRDADGDFAEAAARSPCYDRPCCPKPRSTASSRASRRSTRGCRRRSTATRWSSSAASGPSSSRSTRRSSTLRGRRGERAGLEALLADPEMGGARRGRGGGARRADRGADRDGAQAPPPQGRRRREERHPRNPRRHRRQRGGALRRRPLPHVPALRRSPPLEGRGAVGERGRRRRLQGNHRRRARARASSPGSSSSSGVHRVQRVPATEASGRIHTSAATVAVLPEAEDVDIEIRPEDIRLDTTRASSAGGQHANTTDSGVRILHIPTGIIVTAVLALAAPEPGAGDADAARPALRRRTAEGRRASARRRGRARSAAATAPSASAPTISRKGG